MGRDSGGTRPVDPENIRRRQVTDKSLCAPVLRKALDKRLRLTPPRYSGSH